MGEYKNYRKLPTVSSYLCYFSRTRSGNEKLTIYRPSLGCQVTISNESLVNSDLKRLDLRMGHFGPKRIIIAFK